jgi:hypothetical protein
VWAAISSVAAQIGCTPESLRRRVRQSERNEGQRPGLTTSEKERIRLLERENLELQRTHEILRKASAFYTGKGRPPTEVMVAFLDAHKYSYGVELMYRVLPLALSTYYEHSRRQRQPEHRPARLKRDEMLQSELRKVYEDNLWV